MITTSAYDAWEASLASSGDGARLMLRLRSDRWEDVAFGGSLWASLRAAVIGRGSFEAMNDDGMIFSYRCDGACAVMVMSRPSGKTVIRAAASMIEALFGEAG